MAKDYDTTLARMAGNIAAGFVGKNDSSYYSWHPEAIEDLARASVNIARKIIDVIKETDNGQA